MKEKTVTQLEYRQYQAGDEQSIVTLWNFCLPKDPINQKRFRNLVLLDANFDPEGLRLAFSNDRLVGVVYAVRRLLPMYGTDLELDNGWIPFFFVDRNYQKLKVGSRLLEDACNFLRNAGRTSVFFASYAPNYLLPGIDEKTYPAGFAFLKSMGFSRLYSPIAMDYSLLSCEIPEDVIELKEKRVSEGFTFGPVEDGDLYELIRFANDKFNPDWGRAIREGILQGLPMSRVFVARNPKQQLIGFCLYGGYEGIPERFGPFGVDEETRGTGIGKILLYDCLAAMRAEGLHGAWFLWTGEKTPAGHLYKKVGFSISREFHVMKKSLE
ncbi:GNAT family N-acetyltransferase [Anaerobacillus alkaliphilus]|uniref:GNAT family N-acetyltransferase n=1 Tax=Anaerobacillus alkaliphilus TaxID=1548597 RepID=A0A4Q0VWD9_9BACI|nr:GNAT family N-acetyltransferase [Anaerobacillus alkaliphilus]RXJ02553.1 GNAT family N-acetyltransferase [Anaerobacillus alkaliphilus]